VQRRHLDVVVGTDHQQRIDRRLRSIAEASSVIATSPLSDRRAPRAKRMRSRPKRNSCGVSARHSSLRGTLRFDAATSRRTALHRVAHWRGEDGTVVVARALFDQRVDVAMADARTRGVVYQ
jgi:hypothetical protein